MGVISPRPPWKGRKTQERATGVLEVVIGVFFMITGLMILGVMMVYPPVAGLIVQIGMYSLVFLVAGFILVWDGRRRRNRKKDYQNHIVL